MTNELRTNDEPNRILMEASARIQACYPNGTRIEALIDGKRIKGTVRYVGFRTRRRYMPPALFVLVTDDGELPFYPAANPHRVMS